MFCKFLQGLIVVGYCLSCQAMDDFGDRPLAAQKPPVNGMAYVQVFDKKDKEISTYYWELRGPLPSDCKNEIKEVVDTALFYCPPIIISTLLAKSSYRLAFKFNIEGETYDPINCKSRVCLNKRIGIKEQCITIKDYNGLKTNIFLA